MTESSEIAAAVRMVVAEHTGPPAGDAALLAVDSFTLVLIAESLEARFGIVVAARELLPENFATVQRIAGFIALKMKTAAGGGTS